MNTLKGAIKRIPVLPVLFIAGSALVIFVSLSPWLILTANTPTGGDMGAHVFGPAYMRDNLLPEGRVIGWSNDWFAGFPAFYFYFPLPTLTIVALDLFLPYGVAFKLVTVMGLVAMPLAVYFHARAMTLSRHVSLVASGAGAIFVFYESFTIYGGNVASTLAGEFSYSWSFALSLIYLGLLIKAVRDDRRYLKWAALVLAVTALSHVLTTIVIIFASLFVLAWKKSLWRTLAVWAWGFAIAAFWALPLLARIGLTSDMAWTPLSRWEEIFPVEVWLLLPVAVPAAIWALRKTSRAAPIIAATLLPVVYFPLPNILPELLPELFDGERWKLWNGRLLPYWYFGVAFFAAVGLGAAVVWLSRRLPSRVSADWRRALILLAAALGTGLVAQSNDFPSFTWPIMAVLGTGVTLITFVAEGLSEPKKAAQFTGVAALVLIVTGYVAADRGIDPSALPAWVILFGVAVAGFLLILSSGSPASVGTRDLLVATAVGLAVFGATAGVTFIDGWARWNYQGYEGKDSFHEYQALMAELDKLPDGRVMWENNGDLNKYGTPMSPMLIPYWTEGSHKSMEGLYFESSLTTPFHFINHSEMSFRSSNPVPGLRYHSFDMERGLKHMDVYGVDYYVSFTPEAAEKADRIEGFEKITVTEPFHIYRLPETQLVEVATHLPAVYDVPERGLFSALIGSETVVGADGEPLPSFHDFALEWYEDVDNMHRWVVADGPDEWPRIENLAQRPDIDLRQRTGAVSNIVLEDHRISFRTQAVGVPHVVKVSYFPNWEATGADGPWRAAPSLMVVVPTEENVEIRFADTWAETGGRVLTLAGAVALVGVGVYAFRRRGGVQAESAEHA